MLWVCDDTKLLLCFLLQPITFALVYVGTTLKDLSDVTHGWNEVSTTRWVSAMLPFILFSFEVMKVLDRQRSLRRLLKLNKVKMLSYFC